MSSRWSSHVLAGVLTSLALAVCLASTAQADTIAFWEFNGDDFLADSSVNRHTLSSSGDVSQVNNTASFNGGVLSANIDLSPYRQVTVSWEQSGTGTIVYEHSANYNDNAGAIIGIVGSANLRCNSGYNIDTYSVGTGTQAFSVRYNLDATNVADVVKVFQGTTEIGKAGTGIDHQTAAPAAFINAMFNIGDRQGGNVAPYIGTIDNFRIEGTIPEPGTSTLLVTGLIGLLCYAWRKRK